MPNYFHPLRRKFGVVTLLIACLFAVGWVRSLSIIDMLALPSQLMNVTFVSGEGSFGATSNFVFNFRLNERKEHGRTIRRVEIQQMVKQKSRDEFRWWKFQGTEFRLFRPGSESDVGVPLVPYALIVIPITLLSVWCLLTKPSYAKPIPPVGA